MAKLIPPTEEIMKVKEDLEKTIQQIEETTDKLKQLLDMGKDSWIETTLVDVIEGLIHSRNVLNKSIPFMEYWIKEFEFSCMEVPILPLDDLFFE